MAGKIKVFTVRRPERGENLQRYLTFLLAPILVPLISEHHS